MSTVTVLTQLDSGMVWLHWRMLFFNFDLNGSKSKVNTLMYFFFCRIFLISFPIWFSFLSFFYQLSSFFWGESHFYKNWYKYWEKIDICFLSIFKVLSSFSNWFLFTSQLGQSWWFYTNKLWCGIWWLFDYFIQCFHLLLNYFVSV